MSIDEQLYSPHFYTNDQNLTANEALKGITDLVVVAHADDAEMIAPDVIDACRKDPGKHLGVIIVTDGRGAGVKGDYKLLSKLDLVLERKREQLHAAMAGKYDFLAMLGVPDPKKAPMDRDNVSNELFNIIANCPNLERVVTHNPFDTHIGHRDIMSSTITALRMLAPDAQQKIKVRGGEIWGEISWAGEPYLKAIHLTEDQIKLQTSLLGVHHSQTIGTLDYIPAVTGRQRARMFEMSRFFPETTGGALLALDLSPLIGNAKISLKEYTQTLLDEHSRRMQGFTENIEPTPPSKISSDAKAQELSSMVRMR